MSCAIRLVLFGVICYLQLTSAAYLKCYAGSLEHYIQTPLHKPLALLQCINRSLPTLIYTFGYRGKSTGWASRSVLNAYIAKKKRNVILLDWEEEAASGNTIFELGYLFHAVPNARMVGRALGDSLMVLKSSGINMADFHLMGHSLGAHLMGIAGRRLRERGEVVSRITGLDPAKTLFEGFFPLKGLDRTCAKFVDIIHSDPGGYGISTSMGTVDIWPNYDRNGSPQPGCPKGMHDRFSRDDLCSHDRSWLYVVEAVAAPTAFPCIAADSYEHWVTDGGDVTRKIYLGDLTNTRARGNFYLTTNNKSPFGLGDEGLKPDQNPQNQIRTRRLTFFRKLIRLKSRCLRWMTT